MSNGFKCHVLLTKDLGSVPNSITLVENWGPLTIVMDDDPKKKIHGEHVFLKGDPNDFDTWWEGKTVWMGVGHPQFQRFEAEEYA
jgi:hypothetical protein